MIHRSGALYSQVWQVRGVGLAGLFGLYGLKGLAGLSVLAGLLGLYGFFSFFISKIFLPLISIMIGYVKTVITIFYIRVAVAVNSTDGAVAKENDFENFSRLMGDIPQLNGYNKPWEGE